MSLFAQAKRLASQIYWKYSLDGKKTTIGYSLALALMGGLSMVSYQNATQLTEDNSQVEQAYVTLRLLDAVEANLVDAESARRGYFLFGDATERKRYILAVQALQPRIASLKIALTEPEDRQKLDLLNLLIKQQLSLFQQSIEAFEQRQIEPSSENPLIVKSRQTRQSINQLLEKLRLEKEQSMQVQRTEAQLSLRSRLLIEWLGNALTFLILLGIYIILLRQKFRRETDEARQRQMAQRNELNELKLQFFSMLSHEFRTPLSLISGSVQLLKESLKPIIEPSKLKNLTRIQSSAKLMNQQLNDLLTVARADAGKMEFNPVSLEMQSFCLNLIEDFQTFGEIQRVIQFSKKGQSTHAMVDEKLLYSILSNLLSNALKYSHPQSTVYFLMICEPYAATFEIRDEGVGISLEDQQNLYSLFSRGKNVQETYGSGLGLAVVKRCVDLHQGKILVESQIDVGTKVTVKLSNLGYLS
ncbi:MAG: CHASE3 domain-containing protein [Timaviella obliquedivisa GSE-PSE-MK23-08B]|jgi:signal transduction histidine kinase|nr:CHASE3 domain-containing protein [Timaviella obliquedivisa GSE-PSE-MK23-08B]